ncbi:MAG: hypothetical protein KIT16_17780, partial [Rhodospirillaceae bacterium]|nr:hypothetical protein [Rhodospirillaceae bacterium]
MTASYAAPPVWTLLATPQRIHILRAIAVLVAIVVPLLVIGRGAASVLVPVIGGLVLAALRWPLSVAPLRAALARPLAAALVAMFALWLASVAVSIKPGFSFAIWLQVLGLVLFVVAVKAVLAESPALHRWTLRILLAMGVAGP